MKAEIADRLKAEYQYLFHDSMRELPDGWTELLVVLLEKMRGLSTVGPNTLMSQDIIYWIQIRVEVYLSGAMAFASPMVPSGKWHQERAFACIEALSEFHGQTQEACCVCGAEGNLRKRILGDPFEGIFCDVHDLGAAHDTR